ncbi:MAG: BON domain-containing protein [Undibacterium sp.]|nr:BON domain-containing protein [Undibacterium sp.]
MKTDTQVKSDVLAALQWEPTVDAEMVQVDVMHGIVRLSGPVSSYVEKWDAGRATQRVCGVRGLHSDIIVELPESSRRNDAEIASAVVDVLQWMHYLPKNCIKVEVDRGWISLSGALEWEFQRQAVRGTVRFLIGVKGVHDQLTIISASGAVAAARHRDARANSGWQHSATLEPKNSAVSLQDTAVKPSETGAETEAEIDVYPFFIESDRRRSADLFAAYE